MLGWKSVDVACRWCSCRCLLDVSPLISGQGLVDGGLHLVVEAGLAASSVLTVGRSRAVMGRLLRSVLQRCGLLLRLLGRLCPPLRRLLLLLGSAAG